MQKEEELNSELKKETRGCEWCLQPVTWGKVSGRKAVVCSKGCGFYVYMHKGTAEDIYGI